jgi:hypothetical protein
MAVIDRSNIDIPHGWHDVTFRDCGLRGCASSKVGNSLKMGTEFKMDEQALARSADRSSKGTDGREQGESEHEEIS